MKVNIMKVLIICLISSPALAEKFELGSQQITLPFDRQHLVKTSRPDENLVFFDSSLPAPRPIITVSLSVFRYPADDLSTFKERYRREKSDWLTKENSQMIGDLELFSQAEEKAVWSRMFFHSPVGNFHEWVRFEECLEDEAIVLKLMIPDQFKQASGPVVKKWKKLLEKRLCSSTEPQT